MEKYNFNTKTIKANYNINYNLEDILTLYKKHNFKNIGISDIINMPYDISTNLFLNFYELKKYLNDFKKIKKKHRDINIKLGFLCDYDIKYSKFLIDLKDNCDFIGFSISKEDNIDINYPIYCANKIIEAIDTGIYSFIAKADSFFEYRDKINDKKYLNNCIKAIDMICSKAKKCNIPLEISLKYINNINTMNDNDYPYPTKIYINSLIKYNNLCIIGIDTNKLSDIEKYDISISKIKEKYKDLNIIKDYDPTLFTNNKKYIKFKSKSKSYEYYIIKDIIDNLDYKVNKDEFIKIINKKIQDIKKHYNICIKDISNNINITKNSIIDINKKKRIIKRLEDYIVYNNKSYNNLLNIYNNIIEIINKLAIKYKDNELKKAIKNYYSKI